MEKKNNSMYFLIFPVLLLAFSMNCASIYHGTTQLVIIKSKPENVEIEINGADGTSIKARTPATINLKRKSEYIIVARKGDEKKRVELRKKKNYGEWCLGNLAFLYGAPIGWLSDYYNGSYTSFIDNNIIFTFDEQSQVNPDENKKLLKDSIKNSSGKGIRVAVIDFQCSGIESSKGSMVSALIRDEFADDSRLSVIKKRVIYSELERLGYSRMSFDEKKEAITVGKTLSTKKIVVGTVSVMGERMQLTGRVFGLGTRVLYYDVKTDWFVYTKENFKNKSIRFIVKLRMAVLDNE